MDVTTLTALAKLGAAMALGFAAIGSALGTGTAEWLASVLGKNVIYREKATLYFISVYRSPTISDYLWSTSDELYYCSRCIPILFGAGIIGGIAMGFSHGIKVKQVLPACDALAETGEGFGNYLTTLGIIETVALL